MDNFNKVKDRMFWTVTISFLISLIGLPIIWAMFGFEIMVAVGLVAILIQTLHNGYLINMNGLQRGLGEHNLYHGLRSRLEEQDQKLNQIDGMVGSLYDQSRRRNEY